MILIPGIDWIMKIGHYILDGRGICDVSGIRKSFFRAGSYYILMIFFLCNNMHWWTVQNRVSFDDLLTLMLGTREMYIDKGPFKDLILFLSFFQSWKSNISRFSTGKCVGKLNRYISLNVKCVDIFIYSIYTRLIFSVLNK